jgi:hypothetical protein
MADVHGRRGTGTAVLVQERQVGGESAQEREEDAEGVEAHALGEERREGPKGAVGVVKGKIGRRRDNLDGPDELAP